MGTLLSVRPSVPRHALISVASALCALALAGCGNQTPTPAQSTAAVTGSSGSPSPPGTPVIGPSLTGTLTCDGTDLGFPTDVFSQAPSAELGSGAPAAALRSILGTQQGTEIGFPVHGWRTAVETPESVTFIASAPDGWAWATVTDTPDTGWQFWEGGPCQLAIKLPKAVGFATWRLDPANPPDRSATTVSVLAQEKACASGKAPGSRMLPPVVLLTADAITIAIEVRKRSGEPDCQANPEVPVVVQLSEPLGSRHLFDGSSFPAVDRS